MSDGGLIVLCFALSLVGWFLVIWTCLRAVKRRVMNWNSNLSVWFIMSLGGAGQRQVENWKRWGEYDEGQAKIVIKYQLLCWLGMILSIVASMVVAVSWKALTYEG